MLRHSRTRAAGLLAITALLAVAACSVSATGTPSRSSGDSAGAPTPTTPATAPNTASTGTQEGAGISTGATVPDSTSAGSTPVSSSTATSSTAGSSTLLSSSASATPTSGATTLATRTSAGATPTGISVTAADRAKAAKIVGSMTLQDKAASVLMVNGSTVIGTGALSKQHYGGVILFAPKGVVDGTSTGTPAQVAAVTTHLRRDAAGDPTGVPPLIGTDQEYGAVQRLKNGFTAFPGAIQLGSIDDAALADSLTREVAAAAAQEMLAVGVTVNFAPVFGVLPTSGAASAIGQYGRSYGSNPQRVAALVAAAVTGYQRAGVVSAMKHFPGIARVAADSHVTLPTLPFGCADWNAHEAIPAAAGVDAGALMVMTGHVLFPAAGDTTVPASISSDVVGKLLRGTGSRGCHGMGFTGVTMTDSLQMEPITAHDESGAAAVAALNAGEDLLLMPVDPAAAAAGIVRAVQSGALASARLDAAATAVLALRIASARIPRPPLSVVKSAAHLKLAAEARAAAG